MNHHELQMLVSSYVDGESSEADKAIVRSHVNECIECRLYIDHARQIHTAVQAMGKIELPYGFAARTARLAERGDQVVEEWLGVEPLARNTFLAIVLTVFALFLLTSFNNGTSPGIAEVLIEESNGDSVATHVLLQPGEFSKNDLLYAVMTK